MARHRGFTRKKFLEALPQDLLREYLKTRQVTASSGDLTEGVVNDLLQDLDEVRRKEIEEEFHCINDVADRGMDYLERAYKENGVFLEDAWTRERASMFLFLHHPGAFQMAYDLYVWRTVANSMSHHQLPGDTATFDHDSLDAFQGMVEAFFQKQAKGKRCRLRHYVDEAAHVLLIGRGDHLQTQPVLEDDGEVRTTFFRPAKEDVLLFDPASNILSVKTSGKGSADRTEYLQAFGACILHKTREELSLFGGTTVSLAPIRNGTFSYDGDDRISWVKLVEVQARLGGATDIRLRVNSGDLLRTFQQDLAGLRLDDCELVSAKLRFKLNQHGRTARPLTVEIRPPEHTSLNKRREAEVVESYLRKNGVLLV